MILISGFIIQIIFSITATGFYHPDQHFQIIEFSSYQSGTANAATRVHELHMHLRPTLQVYLFTGWHSVVSFLGITDPYTEMTMLRIILGITLFSLFNCLCIYYFNKANKNVLYVVLLILNFSWLLPYTRTLYSSEMLSALFFFGAAFWYDAIKDKQRIGRLLLLIGLLLSFSFYFRFQTGFLLAGFGLWLILLQKKIRHILPLSIGFLAGIALNTWLDSAFYQQLVFTPYNYYHFNIIDGKAASDFGTSTFLRYIGLLIAVITVPPLSLLLFYYFIKTLSRNYRHWLFVSVFFFIIGHCIVGHKEERFLFPILCIMPVWIGWGLPALFQYYSQCKKIVRYCINGILGISLLLNFTVLVLLIFNPYSQSIHFTSRLKNQFDNPDEKTTIYCIQRTPFETPARNPALFYSRSLKNLEIALVTNLDTLKNMTGENFYLTTTFKQIKNDRKFIDSLGYKPILYSSPLLWKINEFLFSKNKPVIEDIWVLYKK